jgi:hypothetical protein
MSRRLPIASLCAGALAALGAGVACAQTASPYYIGVSQSFSHDSNLLRLADNQDTPDSFSRSDSISATSLVGGLDQTIGRQHVYGSVSIRNSRYSNNTRYNNTGYSANAGLDWSTIERISGSVTASANRSLLSFGTDLFTVDRTRNLESTQALNATVSVGLVTKASAELGAGHRQVRNSLDSRALQSREFDQDNASLGLRWRPSTITSFGLAAAATRGRYPKFILAADGSFVADRFERQDISLSADYRPTGASTLQGTLSKGRTTYDLNSRRNFSGYTGNVFWNWQATGKFALNTSFSRDTGQDSYATASPFNSAATSDYSRISSTFRVQGTWAATAKINAVSSVGYTKRDLVRTIDDPFIPQTASGNDRTTQVSLGARWTPTRTSQIGCDVANERRLGSGELTGNVKSNSVSCFGQITLQ